MNAHDRIFTTLSMEEPDRVPTTCQSIEPIFMENYDMEFEIKGEIMMSGVDLQIAKEMGLDSKWVHTGGLRPTMPMPTIPPELQKLHQNVNIWGQIHEKNRENESWYVDGIVKTPELLREWISYIKAFKPSEDQRYQQFKMMWDDCLSKDFVPIPTDGGPFFTGWSIIGLSKFAYFMRKYPHLIAELFHSLADITIEDHKRFFELGIDMMYICDDHAFKDRIFISPKQFQEFIVPIYKKMAANAHKYGAKFLLHTDGNLWEEFPYLIEAGIDAAEPLEYESGMRLEPLKENFGNKIALIGNIPSSDILSFGTVEDTIAITKKCIAEAAPGGGYILAPGSNIINTAKPKNVLAMIDTVKKFGQYPIKLKKENFA
jgi:hypothetical protein